MFHGRYLDIMIASSSHIYHIWPFMNEPSFLNDIIYGLN
jgi:hypothetical protein